MVNKEKDKFKMIQKSLIQIYWKNRVYTLKEMCELVQKGNISEEDFFEITRMHFDVISKKGDNSN